MTGMPVFLRRDGDPLVFLKYETKHSANRRHYDSTKTCRQVIDEDQEREVVAFCAGLCEQYYV